MRAFVTVSFAMVLAVACSEPAVARDYGAMRGDLERQRTVLAGKLQAQPAETIAKARRVLIAALTAEILPAWDGTAWAMNGTSQVPREGAIACGYFVSTTLSHAGLHVERVKMGQQASTFIIRSLTAARAWKSSDVPIEAFVAKVREGGDGVYVVGLDNHVGYVIVDGRDTWFHHAGPGEAGVRREPALTASFLSTSRYREVAKIFDDALIEKWLRGEAIATVLPARR